MNLFRFLHRSARAEASAPRTRSAERTAWQNLMLCVLGLVVGFAYLLQDNHVGWLFISGFVFFLIMQASPKDPNNE